LILAHAEGGDCAMQLKNIIEHLGSVIKTARIEKHMTQKQLAERLAVTPHYLMSIENKRQIPSCDLLFRIIRELEIPADMVFYPEHENDHALIKKLQVLLSKCDEKDMTVIMATLQSLLDNKDLDRG
jgi:transcriptional regulator with XRE-family HTH domain